MAQIERRYSETLYDNVAEYNDWRVQGVFWVLLLHCFGSFNYWYLYEIPFYSSCVPALGRCLNFGLAPLPYSYSLGVFYFTIFSVLAATFYFGIQKQFKLAVRGLAFLTFIKLLIVMTLSGPSVGYEYFQCPFLILLIFARDKLYFMRLTFVLLYFFSAAFKLNEAWIVGTYFSTLRLGLPLLHESLIPLATNFIIFCELVLSFFLLSKKPRLQTAAVILFAGFHVYSMLMVRFQFPSLCLPLLVLLFYKPEPMHHVKKTDLGNGAFAIIAIVAILNLGSFFIPGDQLFAMERTGFALNMIDTNRQIVSKKISIKNNGETKEERTELFYATGSVSPFLELMSIKFQCHNKDLQRIAWTYDVSVNGGPFYRIIDQINACDLEYLHWHRNSWIRLPPEAPLIGYPEKNSFPVARNPRPSISIFPQQQIDLSSLQKWILVHIETFKYAHIFLAVFSLGFFVFNQFRAVSRTV